MKLLRLLITYVVLVFSLIFVPVRVLVVPVL